jgi:hypothetical protein
MRGESVTTDRRPSVPAVVRWRDELTRADRSTAVRAEAAPTPDCGGGGAPFGQAAAGEINTHLGVFAFAVSASSRSPDTGRVTTVESAAVLCPSSVPPASRRVASPRPAPQHLPARLSSVLPACSPSGMGQGAEERVTDRRPATGDRRSKRPARSPQSESEREGGGGAAAAMGWPIARPPVRPPCAAPSRPDQSMHAANTRTPCWQRTCVLDRLLELMRCPTVRKRGLGDWMIPPGGIK